MKRLFIFLVIIAIVAVGLGFNRGWFTMSTETGGDDNKVDVNLTIDPDKAREDAEELRDNVLPDAADSSDEPSPDDESTAEPSDGSPETESTERTRESNDDQ